MQKTRLSLIAAALITTLPLLQGCVPTIIVTGAAVGVMSAHDRRSTGVQTDDETAEWKAAQSIPEQFKAQTHANFTSYNKRLLITGETPTEEAKAMISERARKIEGVREVYNELAVAAPSGLGNRSNDSYITSKLVTENTVAYLMGVVTEREAKVAVAVARTTDGVRKVVSVMEVLPDADIRRIDNTAPGGSKTPPPQTAPVETR
jgi:osmotically-inducible protein OsmY